MPAITSQLLPAWRKASAKQASLLAAGVAFYGFMAIFPAMIAAVLTYGLVASPETVARQSEKIADVLPADAASIITGQLDSLTSTDSGSLGLGLVIAIVLALYSASGGVGNLVTAVNTMYDVAEERSFVQKKAVALGLTAFVVVFVLVAIGLVAALPVVFNALVDSGPLRAVLELARWLLLIGGIATVLAVLYRYAPTRRTDAGRQWFGSGVIGASVIWLVASLGFSVYVNNFGSYAKTYGALAGVVVLLLWLWISAFAVLYGASLEAESERENA